MLLVRLTEEYAAGTLLSLSLRRKILTTTSSSCGDNEEAMLDAASWLGRVFGHLASSFPGAVAGRIGLDSMLRKCPAEESPQKFKAWFAKFWNRDVARAFADKSVSCH